METKPHSSQESQTSHQELRQETTTRHATIADLEAVQKLNQELCAKESVEYDAAIDPEYPFSTVGEEYFKSRIESPDALTLVVESDGAVVGYFLGSIIPPEDYRTVTKLAEGENMYIQDAYRGQGIGGQLVAQFEQWCRERGVQKIRFVASAENTEGIKFYKTLGCKEVNVTLEKDLVSDVEEA